MRFLLALVVCVAACDKPVPDAEAPAPVEPNLGASAQPAAQGDLPFGASKIVAYSYDPCSDPTNCKGGIAFALSGSDVNRSNVKKKELNAEQAAKVVKWMTAEETYGGAEARCFIPRHSLGFYDAAGKLVGEVSICLECNQLQTSPELDGVPVVNSVVDAEGTVMSNRGFSDDGIIAFLHLCGELSLTHCEAKL